MESDHEQALEDLSTETLEHSKEGIQRLLAAQDQELKPEEHPPGFAEMRQKYEELIDKIDAEIERRE